MRFIATIAATAVGLALLSSGAGADSRVRAKLRPAQVALGETAHVEVVISESQGASTPRFPAVDGLSVRSLGQTVSMHIVNGKVNSEVTHNFVVEPERTGVFTIPPIEVNVGGGTLRTEALVLRVVNSAGLEKGAGQERRHDSQKPGDAPATLALGLPSRELYVGEVLPVTVELYVREGVRVSEVSTPEIGGKSFTVSRPGEAQPEQTRVTIDGRRYTKVAFPLAISPVSAGEIPLTANIAITAIVPGDRRRNLGGMFDDPFFDSFFGGVGVPRKIPITTRPATVRVRALPEAGRPAEFSGGIGRFSLSASASPETIAVGDPLTLSLVVSGQGNFDRVEVPSLESSKDWKTYTVSARFEPSDDLGITGSKVFEQAMIPEHIGVPGVPARTFSYFDPESGRYVTLETKPIKLEILPPARSVQTAARSQAPAPGAAARAGDSETGVAQWEIAPNQVVLGQLRRDVTPLARRPWFLAAQLVPLLAIGAGAAFARRRARLAGDPTHRRRLAARREIRAQLAAMDAAMRERNTPAFFAAARRAIQERVGAASGQTAPTLTLADVEAHALSTPQDDHLVDVVREVMGRADAAAYSGERLSDDRLADWREKVLDALRRLEESEAPR